MAVAVLLLLFAAAAPAQQCFFTLNPASRTVPATPDTIGTLTVTASAPSCQRTAVSDSPDWLTISFGTPGTGNGTIGYRVEANETAGARTGNIIVGNARFTVFQEGAACTFDLSPLSARVPVQAGTGSVRVATRCRWTATSSVSWLRITSAAEGTGDATISYAYDANPTTSARSGVLTVGTRTFSLTQDAAPCTTSLTPTSASYPGDGGSGAIAVASTCEWRAVPSQSWITIAGSATGAGNGTVAYTVAANTAVQARTGTIAIGTQNFTVSQGASNLPRITSITSAASYARDFASPGAILAIFGAQLGPETLAGAELTPDGQFLAKQLAGARVLFDGTPGAMVFASQTVASAIVPYDAAGKRSVRVAVEYQGRRSVEYTLPLAATSPGLFTADASGKGQGAILNEDLTLNGPGNRAARGSIVVIYATGEGVTNPPGVDGKLTGADLPQAAAPVFVSIGGALAEVLYKGGVPGVTAGLVQINARLPAAAPGGPAVPVIVTIGGAASQDGVTLAIQ